jgi:hypothetical protein
MAAWSLHGVNSNLICTPRLMIIKKPRTAPKGGSVTARSMSQRHSGEAEYRGRPLVDHCGRHAEGKSGTPTGLARCAPGREAAAMTSSTLRAVCGMSEQSRSALALHKHRARPPACSTVIRTAKGAGVPVSKARRADLLGPLRPPGGARCQL